MIVVIVVWVLWLVATKPREAVNLRMLMPKQIFLVPGFGAQGGGAEDVKACFNDDGMGAVITAES